MFPNILLGNKAAAENISLLSELGVTHLLNCAGGARRGNLLTGSGKVRPHLGRLREQGIQYKELALKVNIYQHHPVVTFLLFNIRTLRGKIS